MAQRKVTILDKAVEEVAYVAYFIQSKGLPETAKKFVDECFRFFDRLGNDKIKHRACAEFVWRLQGLRCATFKRKYVVAYLDLPDEVIICDFAVQKLIK